MRIVRLRSGVEIEVVGGDCAGPPGATMLQLGRVACWVRELGDGAPWYRFSSSAQVAAWAGAADTIAELASALDAERWEP